MDLGFGREDWADWSGVLESQPAARLASGSWDGLTPGNASILEELDFSHAARVAGSTGQISGGVSVSFAMFGRIGSGDGFMPDSMFNGNFWTGAGDSFRRLAWSDRSDSESEFNIKQKKLFKPDFEELRASISL